MKFTSLLFFLLLFMSDGYSGVTSQAVNDFINGLDIPDNYAKETFKKCFPNTLDTTVNYPESDGTAYIITGDINAMWIRDSCAQIHPYIYLCKNDNTLKNVIKGTILRHIKHFNRPNNKAPYINAWDRNYNPYDYSPYTGYYKLEADGIPYVIRLCYTYWKVTGDTSWATGTGDFNATNAFNKALDLLEEEQTNHPYTGMVWCTHRPSDDECWSTSNRGAYHVPSNMFLVAMLPKLAEMYTSIWNNYTRATQCIQLRNEILAGITNYAIVEHPVYGKIFAYEVKSPGQYILMDDANVPSLLSAPYIGFCSNNDPIYINTRKFLLSTAHQYFYSGKFCKGIGSPHTPSGRAWPMSIIIQALTSDEPKEIETMLTYLNNMDAGTHYMHEGVDVNNPANYSRSWFAWANTLYGELIMKKILGLNFYPDDGVYIKPYLNNRFQYVKMTNRISFGNLSNLKIYAYGNTSEIISAKINSSPATIIDPIKGVKITSENANIIITNKLTVSTNQKMIDLTSYFNRDGISWDSNKNDGSISGTGNTSYDANYLPDILYSAYSGLKFRIGNKNDGQKNVIACSKQLIQIPGTNISAGKVSILAVGINGNQYGSFRIYYQNGDCNTISKYFTDWCADEPLYEEKDALVMGHRHDAGNDQIVKTHIYEHLIYLDKTKPLSAIQLPDNQNIIVLAITLSEPTTSSYTNTSTTEKIPKFPVNLRLSKNMNNVLLSWKNVDRNYDNTPLTSDTEILFYRIYKSPDLKNWTKVMETSLTQADITSFYDESAYYKVTAVNRGLKESISKEIISGSSNIIFILQDLSETLLVKVILPFNSASSLINNDLWIDIKNLNQPDALYAYIITPKKYSDDTEFINFKFNNKATIQIYYKIDPVTGNIFGTETHSSLADKSLKLFKYNGIEWIVQSSIVNVSASYVAVDTEELGNFAIMLNSHSEKFSLSQIEPRKIFTPNGPPPHNIIKFYFENPEMEKITCKIFNLKGKLIKELPLESISLKDGYFYWDGKDKDGKICNSGVYIYQLESKDKVINGTIILSK